MASGPSLQPPDTRASSRSDPLGTLDALDRTLAAALFAALLVALVLGFQGRYTGDGALLANRFHFGTGRDYPHALYLPACDLLGKLPFADPVAAPKVLSALGGALGGALTYLLCRGFGAGRASALFGALLLVASPVFLFFSTTIEVHAFHLGAVTLAACAALFAPWRRPGLALAVALCAFPLTFLSHRAGAVHGLGWLLLLRLGRERVGPPFAWRTTLFVHGPLLLAVTCLGLALANLAAEGVFALQTESQRLFIASFHRPPAASRMWLDGWIAPLALLLPCAAVGFARAGSGGASGAPALARWVPLAVVAPVWAYFFWWGVAERGGYFLGTAPFLAALAARALPVRTLAGGLAALTLVAAELVLGVRTVRAWDTGFRADERLVQAERALGERGWLVSFAALAPRVDVWKPALVELPQDEIFREVLEARTPVPEYAAAGLANLRGLLDYGPVALDLAYERLPDDPVLALRRPYAEALVAAARAELDTELFDHPDWPVLLLRPR